MDRFDTDAWLGTAPLDRSLLVGDTIEGQSWLVPDRLDTIARPLMGDATKEFDDADARQRSDTLVTPPPTGNLPLLLEILLLP